LTSIFSEHPSQTVYFPCLIVRYFMELSN